MIVCYNFLIENAAIKYSVLRQAKPRLAILETELAKSWLTPEEDNAWKNL